MNQKVSTLLKFGVAMLFLMVLSVTSLSAQRKITGNVSDENGPIPGVSIVVKGTTNGAITDVDGNFALDLKTNDATSIVVSSVGYTTQEIAVGTESNITVKLAEDVSTLSEVVVTGYAVETKRQSTGAVSTIKAKDLRAIPSGNVEQQLQGRVTGVTVITNGQPGTNSIIRVRGFGAFGGNEPLYVVDGVPVQSTNFLSPDDIETATVLKDAPAASIYGARAANGVIVYTTKKGSKGAKKLSVSYDGLYGSTDPNVAGAPKMLSPQEDAQWTHTAYKNNAAANGTAVKYSHPQYGTNETPVLPAYLHANGVNGITGSVDLAAIQAASLAKPGEVFLIKPNLAGTNWFDEITRTAPLSRHNLGLSGGTENGRFYIGMSMQDQKGILINNSFKRYTFRTNSEFSLTKKLRIGQNLQFTYRSVLGQAGGNGGLGIASDESQVLAAYRMPTIIPVFDELGQYASTKAAGYNNPRNPVRTLTRNNGNDRNYNANAFGNLYLELDPIANLTLRSSIGGQFNNNFFKDYNYRYLGDSEPEASNSFNEGGGYSIAYVFSNTASYKLKVGNHGATILAGMEALNTGKGRNMSGSGLNPFSMDLDYVNLSTVGTPQVNSGLFSGTNIYSLFGKLDYNLSEKYYVTGVIRRDGSSVFGPNSRYGIFPAFSAAWRITGEEFMKNLSFISDLKVRGGWGQMGNSNNVNPFNQFSLYGSNRSNSFYPIEGQNSGVNEGYNRTRIGNPDAKWETSEMTNIGFDASFLNNKLEFVLDIWRKDTRDLLFNVPLPAVIGPNAAAPAVNIASMRNQGIDFQLINRGNITKDLKYEVSLNNSFLQNSITYLTPNLKFFGAQTGGDVAFRGVNPTRNAVGQPMASFFGYKVLGYFTSAADVTSSPAQAGAGVGRFKYQDVNGDGAITPDDRTFIGSPIPKYTGGGNINLTYKQFTVDAFFNMSLGNDIFNFSKWFTDFFGSFEGSGKGVRAKQSWTPALGNAALAPIWESASNLSTNAASNSWYVESGDYLRLQNLAIGYTLDNKLVSKIGLSRAKVTLAAFNLFTITKYSGLDPAVGGAVDTNLGIDVGNYPTTRGFNLALSLGF